MGLPISAAGLCSAPNGDSLSSGWFHEEASSCCAGSIALKGSLCLACWLDNNGKEKKNNPKVKLRKYASSLIFQSINIKHTVGASRLVQWLRAHLPVQGSGKASRAAGQRACVHRIREGPTCCGATSRVHRIWEGPTCRGATSRVHRIREGPTCHRATSLCAPHPGRPHVLRSDKPVCPAAVGPVCSSPELSS